MFRRSINTLLLPGIVACLLVLIPSCALLDHVAVYIVNCAQDNVRIQGPLGTNLHLTLSSVCSENEREYLTALDNNIWVREFSLNRSVGGCLQTMTIALPDGPGIDFIEEEEALESTIYLYEQGERGFFSYEVKGNYQVKVLFESCP